MLTLSSAL